MHTEYARASTCSPSHKEHVVEHNIPPVTHGVAVVLAVRHADIHASSKGAMVQVGALPCHLIDRQDLRTVRPPSDVQLLVTHGKPQIGTL